MKILFLLAGIQILPPPFFFPHFQIINSILFQRHVQIWCAALPPLLLSLHCKSSLATLSGCRYVSPLTANTFFTGYGPLQQERRPSPMPNTQKRMREYDRLRMFDTFVYSVSLQHDVILIFTRLDYRLIHLHSQPFTSLNKQRHADPQKTEGLASVTCLHIRGSHQSILFLIITWLRAVVRSAFSTANHSSHEPAQQNLKQNGHDVMTIPNMDIRLLQVLLCRLVHHLTLPALKLPTAQSCMSVFTLS